jgi:hypothetical protein
MRKDRVKSITRALHMHSALSGDFSSYFISFELQKQGMKRSVENFLLPIGSRFFLQNSLLRIMISLSVYLAVAGLAGKQKKFGGIGFSWFLYKYVVQHRIALF